MRRFVLLTLMLSFVAPAALAQWEFAGAFPDDTSFAATPMHGVAVDPDGKVWLTPYFATESIITTEDTVATRAIYVYNEDGTPADFSPIQIITVDGDADTLTAPSTGLASDADGNILHVSNGQLYRIDYMTGEGLDRILVQEGTASLTKPAVDDQGNIYTANVLQDTGPLRIFDPELNFIENAVDTTRGFSRSFAVTGDGSTIYWGGFTNEAVWKYTRPDEFSPFNAVPDTTDLVGMTAESFIRHPTTGNIWISAGAGAQAPYRTGTWYEVDPATDTVIDSLVWDRTAGYTAELPRGIAFTPDGNTAYVVMYDATTATASAVQKFTSEGTVAIEKVPGDLPERFTLEQNYPNPFNPSTQIDFALHEAGHASLKVFDVLGREVAVLIDQTLAAGNYSTSFDGSRLTSGTYLYVLSVNGERQSGKMILAK